jgi:hypothetical protein
MIETDSVPPASAPAEYHADFLELCTLRSNKRSLSVQEFIRDLRLGNASEVFADSSNYGVEESDDEAESIAQTAFDELDERGRNFGKRSDQYPFVITPNTIQLKDGADERLYTFLALLSWYGKNAGPPNTNGEKLFEEVCAKASEGYFGASDGRVKSFVFGFPRSVEPKGFAKALDKLCKSMGEGGGHRKGRPMLPDQKDGKLDIVTWVEFHDSRQSKLITFGQCATGRNWEGKISELPPPDRWCGHWMDDTPTVLPTRSFFVPHRIVSGSWSHSSTFGGILYDRCRIASLVSEANEPLKTLWTAWSYHILGKIRAEEM